MLPAHRGYILPVPRKTSGVVVTAKFDRERQERRLKQFTVVAPAGREVHERRRGVRRMKIEEAIELGVPDPPNVHFLQQPQQPVVLYGSSTGPTVEVKATNDFIPVATLVQLVDLFAASRSDNSKREGGPEISKRNMQLGSECD